MKYVAIGYLKKALMLSWVTNDTIAEISYYDKLAVEYFNLGDTTKCKMYKDRAFYSQFEEIGSLNHSVAMDKEEK